MQQGKKILIIDDVHASLIEGLEKEGFQVDYKQQIHADEVRPILHQYDGLVLRSKLNMDKNLINAGLQLKFIARAGSGMDNVDEAYALQKNITCINTPEANSDAVGEHTIAMLLGLLNKINKADREVRNKIWNREDNRGIELKGKTVGIIGYGHTGMAVAKKLAGFEVRVMAYDKYKIGFGNELVKEVSLEEIFSEADILSLHIPLNDETKWMVNADFLSRFSKSIFFLNLSRGKIVNTQDLVKALEANTVKGCALDVLEKEEILHFNDEEKKWLKYLIESDKTLLTPHVAGWTYESYEKISFYLLTKIKRLNWS